MNFKLLKLYFGSKDPLKDEIPWMTYGAIRWLDKNIDKQSKVFEWGSGGSTIFLARRCGELISVEHDPTWYSKVESRISKFDWKVKYKLFTLTKGGNYISSDKTYKGMTFEKYCNYINNFPDNYFDFVIVDGRARNDCIRLAKIKVKHKGRLILDNSEREVYKKGIYLLKKWNRLDFEGNGPINPYKWQTTIFQK